MFYSAFLLGWEFVAFLPKFVHRGGESRWELLELNKKVWGSIGIELSYGLLFECNHNVLEGFSEFYTATCSIFKQPSTFSLTCAPQIEPNLRKNSKIASSLLPQNRAKRLLP